MIRYGVAVYKKTLYDGSSDVRTITLRNNSCRYYHNIIESQELEEDGFKPTMMVFTNNEEVFYKARLKASLEELREYLKWCDKDDCYVPTLMTQVGMKVSACLFRDIEVTDELAIQCYNYREQQRAEKRRSCTV